MSVFNGGVHKATIQRIQEAQRSGTDGGVDITEKEFDDIAKTFMTRGFFDTNTLIAVEKLDPKLAKALEYIKTKALHFDNVLPLARDQYLSNK